MKAMRTFLLGGVAALALTACDRIGSPFDALGGKRATPDEFRVVTRKPLNMPGGAARLPEPRLGERSPLEHDPGGDAREALTGERTGASSGGSAGESALVAAATANTPNSTAAAGLAEREAELDKNKPYEPPTVMEMLNLDGRPAEDVLDPDAEARRLRAGGTAKTPVNPNDAAGATEAGSGDDDYVSPGEKFEPKFPYGNQRKGS